MKTVTAKTQAVSLETTCSDGVKRSHAILTGDKVVVDEITAQIACLEEMGLVSVRNATAKERKELKHITAI